MEKRVEVEERPKVGKRDVHLGEAVAVEGDDVRQSTEAQQLPRRWGFITSVGGGAANFYIM